jgi:hypothetical protein
MDDLTWDFNLLVPQAWYVYDPDPDRWVESTAREVDERIRHRPALAPVRQWLIDLLVGFWRDAHAFDALTAATLYEPGEPAALAANLTVVFGRRQAPGSVTAEIDTLLASLTAAKGNDVGQRDIVTVDLPAGRAVRLRALTRTDEGGGEPDEVLIDLVQHWVPVPGHRAMIVLSGTTPCLDLADDLAAVFDGIAESLEFSDVAG